MGYIVKDIADITEPKRLSLAGSPNFVQFTRKPSEKIFLEVELTVNATPSTPSPESATILNIKGNSIELARTYFGTTNKNNLNDVTYLISSDPSESAENLRQLLIADSWFNTNFDITIPAVWKDDKPKSRPTLFIKSKGAGADYNISITAPNNDGDAAYSIRWINRISINNDSISGSASTIEIDLDVYTDPSIFLGQDDRPINPERMGRYINTLQKTYSGSSLWFDLHSMFEQYGGYNTPPEAPGWFDPGTLRSYRFAAKLKGVNSFTFYYSNALYVLNGRGPAFEALDLEEYVYKGKTVKLLTNKPRTSYVSGQREFLNFLFSDPHRNAIIPNDYSLQVAYRVYSTADNYLGIVLDHGVRRIDFNMINSCRLNMDTVLDKFPTAGIIRVSLARGGVPISNDIEYRILPESLHELRQFSFLNRLGGWDTYNFDGELKDEYKPKAEVYNKTLTPAMRKGDSTENVYSVTLQDTYTVEGAPVNDVTAEWLKELAVARTVLDGDGNYIIIEDFSINDGEIKRPIIKYRYDRTIY